MNVILFKTIKTTCIMVAAAAFLTACTTYDTVGDSSDSSSTNDPSSATAGSSSGSNVTTVDTGSVAPTSVVFFFDFNSSALRADSRTLLDGHAAALRAKPRAVRLEGHADERGTREYNMALGERRAQSVRAYLLSKGVTAPIEVVSFGEEKPVVTMSNDYAWQQNRRVVIR
jgi:peptidoglycan-associated lipoprotein